MGFNSDLLRGKVGEKKALQLLEYYYGEFYEFTNVSDSIVDRHKGDIRITSKETGVSRYIDIKTDSRISSTGNIFVETDYTFFNSGITK